MLEIKEYTGPEIAAELGISLSVKNLRSCIKGKLDRLGIDYHIDGNGKNATYTIVSNLLDEFKVYCMEHFGCAPNTDFRKMRDVFFFALNDPDFLALPDTEKEQFLDKRANHVNRGSISNYLGKLVGANYLGGGDYIYLVVNKDEKGNHISEQISMEQYKKGWKLYWDTREITGGNYTFAYYQMRKFLGGHPLKRLVPLQNGIMASEIDELQKAIIASYENDIL